MFDVSPEPKTKPERFFHAGPFMASAMSLVYAYAKKKLDVTDTDVQFELGDVYIVWFSKTLQNWKAMVSTNLPDGMYYEVTYNGDKDEVYLDAYKKFENVKLDMSGEADVTHRFFDGVGNEIKP